MCVVLGLLGLRLALPFLFFSFLSHRVSFIVTLNIPIWTCSLRLHL